MNVNSRHDDLVARPHPGAHERHVQAGRTAGRGQREPGAHVSPVGFGEVGDDLLGRLTLGEHQVEHVLLGDDGEERAAHGLGDDLAAAQGGEFVVEVRRIRQRQRRVREVGDHDWVAPEVTAGRCGAAWVCAAWVRAIRTQAATSGLSR